MLKRSLALVGAALLIVGCNSNNEGFKASPNETSTDNMFFHDAALANMAEIQEANVALNQSQNEAVRQFAQRMVNDHTQAKDQLSQLANSKGVTLPTDLDSDDANAINNAQKLSGSSFDSQYVSDQIKDHEQAVKEFEHEATTGNDPDVKNWALQTLPTLKMHLKMAQDLQAKLSGGNRM